MKPTFAFNPRIIRSPWADFYGPELETALEAYPDDYLREIAAEGFNGIWLHARLREVVASRLFGGAADTKRTFLKRLVEKAGRHGVKVFLYLNEPRGLRAEDPFWRKHPEVKGQPTTVTGCGPYDGVYHALCSSTPAVREFLEESTYRLFKRTPGLGGVFCITASEHHTHCYSHYTKPQKRYTDPNFEVWAKDKFICPRCAQREASDVVAEVITLIHRGLTAADPEALTIAWTWSWVLIEPDPQKNLIARLPPGVRIMSDWERGARKKVCGKIYPLDEYSLSYPGPSPRFRRQLAIARKHGRHMMAKLQIGATHELAAVPYLPVPQLLALKMSRMRQHKVDGYLACWIFGGEVSPMSKVCGRMSRMPAMAPGRAIREVAEEEFGPQVAPAVVRAWAAFSAAWRKYPFSIPLVYYGPMNYATAYPLSLNMRKQAAPPGWLPLPRDGRGRLVLGDDLERWIEPFTPAVVTGAFRQLLTAWDKGLAILQRLASAHPDHRRLTLEANLAKHIALSIQSTINIVEFYPLYREYRAAQAPEEKRRVLRKIAPLLQMELRTARRDRELVVADPRLGYHPEAHTHLFTSADLDYKAAVLERTLKNLPS